MPKNFIVAEVWTKAEALRIVAMGKSAGQKLGIKKKWLSRDTDSYIYQIYRRQ